MARLLKPFVFTILTITFVLGIGTAKNIVMLVGDVNASTVESAGGGYVAAKYIEPRSIENVKYTSNDNDSGSYDSDIGEGTYEVYHNEELLGGFDILEDAVTYASKYKKTSVRERGKQRWLWDNYPPYLVFNNRNDEREFNEFSEAVAYGKRIRRSSIYYRKDNSLIWSNMETLSGSALIHAPHVSQLPELPRGCEVTSLAMLLKNKGINVDKMTLASAVKKDHTPYKIIGGKIYYGDPNDGFVGEMDSFNGPGLGVYHSPIHALLQEYLPDSALDLTGCDFEDLFYFLENGSPVWIVTNASYRKLPSSSFITWHTSSGDIQITYREHSVLVTGYDSKMVYFNDPLGGRSKAPRASFIEAWEQMGRQAVTYTP